MSAKASSGGCIGGTPRRGILRQLPDVARPLRPEITVAELERIAKTESDTQAARKMQEAKRKLFGRLRQQRSA